MPNPAWITVTAANIITDSRLTSFMLQGDYTEGDAQADAERLLGERVPLIISRLRRKAMPLSWPFTADQWETAFPDEDAEARTGRDADQKSNANLIIKETVIAALLKPLGDEKSDRAARAVIDGRGESVIGVARVGSVDDMLKQLEDEIREIALIVANKAGKKKKRGVILTGRGDYSSGDVVPCNSAAYLESLNCP